LMHVLHMGNCHWIDGNSLISPDNNYWNCHRDDTCVTTEPSKKLGILHVMYASKYSCEEVGYNVISLEDFYREQGITPQEIEEIGNI